MQRENLVYLIRFNILVEAENEETAKNLAVSRIRLRLEDCRHDQLKECLTIEEAVVIPGDTHECTSHS